MCQILVGGGWGRGWGTLAEGVQTGSDVIRENPVRNPSVETTTPDAKRLTHRNIQVTLPLVNCYKQKHMRGGAHGPRIRNNGGWVKYWSQRVGVAGGAPWPAGPNRKWAEPRGKTLENPPMEKTTHNPKSFIGCISPQLWSYHPHNWGVTSPNYLELPLHNIGIISDMTWVLHPKTLWSCLPRPSALPPIGGWLACKPA